MPDPENNYDADRQGFQQGVVAPERGGIAMPVPVEFERDLGASRHHQVRLRTHSQNMTVAARQIAEKNTVGHLS